MFVVLPFQDKVDVNEVQHGGGTGGVDLRHDAFGVLIKWVVGGALSGRG